MNVSSIRSWAVTLNALSLYAIGLVLAIAFAAQLLLGELPCPLCLMQRIQFAMLAVGPVLNIRFGPRPSHYAVSLLSAVAGAGFAMRQVLLHIVPGDAGYGTALLGYHYYSWAFIGFSAAIVLSAVMLLFDSQFTDADSGKPPTIGWFGRGAIWFVIALVALNVISTLFECGFAACPDNPVNYQLLLSLR
jgi:disulfide bond formation protein DsbB